MSDQVLQELNSVSPWSREGLELLAAHKPCVDRQVLQGTW